MNPFKKFVHNKRAFEAVIGAILAVVVASVLLIVAALIISNVNNALPNVTDPQANATITNVVSGAYNALNLLQIVLVVLAAAAIIAAIMGGFMYMKSRKG